MREEVRKVTVLLGSFSGGGSERAMINFSNVLVKRGFELSVIVSREEGPFRSLLDESIPLFVLDGGMLKSITKIRTLIRRLSPDIVFSSQIHVNLAAVFSCIGLSPRPKVVLREATTPSEDANRSSGLSAALLFFAAKRMFKRADSMIAVSEDCKEDSINFYGLDRKKIRTVYTPFVNQELLERSKEVINHEWFDGSHKVVVSLGRVMPEKDFATLIKGFAIARKSQSAKLVVIGATGRAPEYFQSLLDLARGLRIEDDIDFIGFKLNPFPYLANAHVYALSSLYEGLPGSLVQGLALGCNVVATDCKSGPREVLKDGLYGELVKVGDFESLGLAISRALSKDLDRDSGIEKTQDFTEKGTLDNLLDLFDSLLS